MIVDVAEPMFGIQIGKQTLNTHAPDQCSGAWCCVHNPSPHHMATWPMNWRSDRNLMERRCPHGVGHPDPDHLGHVRRTLGPLEAGYESVHGCDGCCREASEHVDMRAVDSAETVQLAAGAVHATGTGLDSVREAL